MDLSRVTLEPLRAEHLDELAEVLRHPLVYEHIEPRWPSLEEFRQSLQRAIAGPPAGARDQVWLNFLVREIGTGVVVGRVEATLHDGIAEVAFLIGPRHWGRGLGSAALGGLHACLERHHGVRDCWATTTPANARSQRLLRRHGYVEAAACPVRLWSYDPGDRIFHRRAEGAETACAS